MTRRKRGWFGEPGRHSLAAQGIKSPCKSAKKKWSKGIDVKEGALQGWQKTQPQKKRLQILHRVIRDDGYATTIRRLNYLRNISNDPGTDRAAKADMVALQSEFGIPIKSVCKDWKD
jgi:hypothetical protein